MLTELALVLGLDFVGLAFVGVLGRWIARRPAGNGEARRLVSAAARAAESFLWRETRLAFAAGAAAALLVLGGHALLFARRLGGYDAHVALWSAFAAILGAAGVAAVAHLSAQIGLRCTSRTLRAADVSLDHAAGFALRGAAIGSLSTEALGALIVTGLFGLLYLIGGGGLQLGIERAEELVDHAARVLPGFALGAVTAALVFGMGGATYQVSARVGGLSAPGLEMNDPRNPSLVAALVGAHVGVGARRAVDQFAGGALANVVVVLLGAAALRENGGATGNRAWALVTLPLVTRGIGLVAAGFGVLSSRTTEAERASNAVFRGQIAAVAVFGGGLAGAVFWLLGAAALVPFVGAGLVGAGAAIFVGHFARYRVDRRFGPLQGMLEGARSDSSTLARGVALGFRGIFVPTVGLGASLLAALALGGRSGLAGGALLATSTALAAFLSVSTYMLALGLFGPIVSGAVTVLALDREKESARPETERRVLLLDEAGFESGTASDSFSMVFGALSSLLAGLAILIASSPTKAATPLLLSNSSVLWAGLAGGAIVVTLSGGLLERASRSARKAAAEVERQLSGFPGKAELPDNYTPSYRTLIELVARSASEGVFSPSVTSIAAVAAVGFALRLVYASGSLAAEGLASVVVVAATTGLGLGLATAGAGAALAATHRARRTRGGPQGLEPAFGSFVGEVLSPAASLLVKGTAAAALVIAPLLSGS